MMSGLQGRTGAYALVAGWLGWCGKKAAGRGSNFGARLGFRKTACFLFVLLSYTFLSRNDRN